MDNLTEQLHEALKRYFASLTLFGYSGEDEVNKLLIFLYLTDMLQGPFANFITEADYNLFNNALYSLYGTTYLLPYPIFTSNLSILNLPRIGFNIRVTQTQQIRQGQNLQFRITE